MHRDREGEIHVHKHTHNDTNQHNRPGDGIMQCCCGWFFNEIWSCLSAICNSWFPTTKTEWVKTKQNKDRKGVKNKALGEVLMNK